VDFLAILCGQIINQFYLFRSKPMRQVRERIPEGVVYTTASGILTMELPKGLLLKL